MSNSTEPPAAKVPKRHQTKPPKPKVRVKRQEATKLTKAEAATNSKPDKPKLAATGKKPSRTLGSIVTASGVYVRSGYNPIDSVTLPALLTAIANTGNLTLCCRRLNINLQSLMRIRREDPQIDAVVREALAIGHQGWEDEAARRAFEGVERPIYSQGILVGTAVEFSDRLAEFLIRGNNPDKYNPPQRLQHGRGPDDPAGGSPLKSMTDDELNRLLSQKLQVISAINSNSPVVEDATEV